MRLTLLHELSQFLTELEQTQQNLLALFTDKRIRLRGARENLYFVDKRKLKRGFRFGPEPIPSPLQKLSRWVRSVLHRKAAENAKSG